MFPLSELSILFTALLIIVFSFLGVFVLFGLLIIKNSNKNEYCVSNIPSIPHLPLEEQPTELRSRLTVSDWVTFLSSEKYGAINTILNVGVFLIAVIAYIFANKLITNTTWQIIVYAIIILGLIIYALKKVLEPFEKRGKPAGKILEEIMRGDLRDEETIQKRWIEETRKIKNTR